METALQPEIRDEMRVDRRRMIREIAQQRAHCQGRSPFYVAVLAEIEADMLEQPAWLDRLELSWAEREFAVGWEAAHLLLANLHYAALIGEAPDLRAAYPSCGGDGLPRGGVAAFLHAAPDIFWQRLRDHHVQTNEVDRSVPWLLVAASALRPRGMPFHFVEMGSSAGLNLVGDLLPHECAFVHADGSPWTPPDGWDQPQSILTRTGLDIRPRDLRQATDRLWLRACVWADDMPRLKRLDLATAAFLRAQGSAGAPALQQCDFAGSSAWLRENRPAREGEGLVVFNSIGTVYLSHGDYAHLRDGMAEALAPWGDRGLWVEYERARGVKDGPLELAVHQSAGRKLVTRVLGSGEPRPQRLVMREGWGFPAGR